MNSANLVQSITPLQRLLPGFFRQQTTTSLALLAAFAMTAASAHANLVSNSGFELGATDWTITGPDTSVNLFDPHSGLRAANFFSSGAAGTFSQDIATVVGQSYDISFWLMNNDGPSNSFDVTFGLTTLVGGGTPPLPIVDTAPFAYTQYTFAGIVATNAVTTLSFTGRSVPGTISLDDIVVVAGAAAVTAVPEPGSALVGLLALGLCTVGLGRRQRPVSA